MLVRVFDIQLTHLLEASDFKIERLVGLVDKMPDVVVRENILNKTKVGIFRILDSRSIRNHRLQVLQNCLRGQIAFSLFCISVLFQQL